MRCPDCDSVAIDPFDDRGNGVCSVCHGGGVGDVMDEIAEGVWPTQSKCYNCDGNGQCPTCGGTGRIQE
jgi:DnaJ-class molecular chaperone